MTKNPRECQECGASARGGVHWCYDYAPIKGYEDTHPVNIEKSEERKMHRHEHFTKVEPLQHTRDDLIKIISKAYNDSAGFTFQACAGDVVDALAKAGALKVLK